MKLSSVKQIIINDRIRKLETHQFHQRFQVPSSTLSWHLNCRWSVDQKITLRTDHMPTVLELDDGNQQPPKEKWDLKHVNWPSWCESLDMMIARLSGSQEFLNMEGPEKCKALENAILAVSSEVIGKKTITKHSKAFFTPKLKELQDKLRKAQARFKGRRDRKNQETLNIAKSEYNDTYVLERDKFWQEICDKTNPSNLWDTVKKIISGNKHNVVQPLRNEDGSYEFDDAKIADRLKATHITRENNTSTLDPDWKVEVETELTEIITQNRSRLGSPREPYNYDLTESEMQYAIRSLKIASSPGPDGILPVMLHKGCDVLTSAMTLAYQQCWETGTIPDHWKTDDKIFVPKPVPDMHKEKSYRPLSLTSVLGKTDERIKAIRLVWWLESQFTFDPSQYAYRKYRGVTQAMLYLISCIREGFSEGKSTITALIDLQGARGHYFAYVHVYRGFLVR